MRAHRRLLALAATTTLVFMGCRSTVRPTSHEETVSSATAPGRSSAASLEQKMGSLRTDLDAKGYQVGKGYPKLFTIDDCKYSIASIGNCVGNNPAAPYVIPSVPLWPDEYVDETQKDALGPHPEDTWATFRLDPREAVVILGDLPPPAAYFGLHVYVYSRQAEIPTDNPVYQEAPPRLRELLFMNSANPSRVMQFATFGNSQNDVVIEQQSGAAFGRQRAFVITPDAVMAQEMTDALLRAGVPERDHVFVTPVPSELLRLGLGAEADDFVIVMRYTHPDDEAAGERWRKELPLKVLRVRATDETRAAEPYPTPTYDARTARSELGLKDDLEALVTAVKEQWGQPDASEQPFKSLELTVDLIGQHCIERPMNCLGDNQDEDFRILLGPGLDSGEVLAVVGTLGTETGNASYSALSINRASVLSGVANIFHDDLKGTASAFKDRVEDADKLFVQYVARDCTGLAGCFEVTEEMVPRGEPLGLVERDYVVPGTPRGADPEQLLNPVLVVLDGKARPESR